MTKALCYCRFSPRRVRQDSEGNAVKVESIETQLAYIKAFAAEKGYEIVGAPFVDEALSGGDEDRPQLIAAINSLTRGMTLLVYKRDRVARDPYLAESVRRAVKRKGGSIVAVQGDIDGDPNDPMVQALRKIMDVIDELSRRVTAKLTSDAMLRLQASGRRMGRYAPYGTRLIDDANGGKTLQVVPEECVAVDRIKSLHASGKTAWQIARIMDAEMPDLSRGNKWSPVTVAKIAKRQAA